MTRWSGYHPFGCSWVHGFGVNEFNIFPEDRVGVPLFPAVALPQISVFCVRRTDRCAHTIANGKPEDDCVDFPSPLALPPPTPPQSPTPPNSAETTAAFTETLANLTAAAEALLHGGSAVPLLDELHELLHHDVTLLLALVIVPFFLRALWDETYGRVKQFSALVAKRLVDGAQGCAIDVVQRACPWCCQCYNRFFNDDEPANAVDHGICLDYVLQTRISW